MPHSPLSNECVSQHAEQAQYHQWLATLSPNNIPLFVGELLERAARLFPEKPALIIPPTEHITFQTLATQAQTVSAHLAKQGLKPRDRVLLFIENHPFFYAAYYGALQNGLIVAPVSTFLNTQELAHIIQDAQPQCIIVSEQLKERLTPETIPGNTVLLTEPELLSPCDSHAPTITKLAPEETCVILYTSGTTGHPKGVMLSSRSIISNIAQGLARFQVVERERVLCPLPLFHSFTQLTCVWGSMATGACVILLPRISRTSLMEGAALKPTIVLGIPGLYGLLCRFPTIRFPNVRLFICGGEALPNNIRRYFALRFGRLLCNGYGLTESGPVISLDVEDYLKPTHTIGKPLADIECKLIRDAQTAPGTLWVSGPNIMNGYYRAPEATAKILQDNWLNTGDLARFDAFGNLVICGREKDLITHKGIKVYPQEVETVLSTHPDVILSAVIGAAEDEGEYPVAYDTVLLVSHAVFKEGYTVPPKSL